MLEGYGEEGGPMADQQPTKLIDRTGYLAHKLQCVLLPAIENGLAEAELNTRGYFVLSWIDQPQPPSQKDLSRALRIDATTIVAVVDELERLGYVNRVRSTADRRRYDLHLTPAGRAALERAGKAVDGVEQEVFAPLGADEHASLHALLDRLLAGR